MKADVKNLKTMNSKLEELVFEIYKNCVYYNMTNRRFNRDDAKAFYIDGMLYCYAFLKGCDYQKLKIELFDLVESYVCNRAFRDNKFRKAIFELFEKY